MGELTLTMQVARYMHIAFDRKIQQAPARDEESQGNARHREYQTCSQVLIE
jgi:hypothetical protein